MNLWKLELLRMTRTRRWIAIVAVFAFFGILGPLSARYIGEIVEQFGGGIEVVLPDPTPADGIMQYSANAQQLGFLILVMVAAGALTMEARYEMAVFLRTRVQDAGRLLVPRYVVVAGTGIAAWIAGTLLAWYETSILIGAPDAGALLVGMAYGAVYLLFVVAVVALAGAVFNSVVPAAIASLAVLLIMPLIGLLPDIGKWLPSHLVGALDGLVRGEEASSYVAALLVALGATLALLYGTMRVLDRREL